MEYDEGTKLILKGLGCTIVKVEDYMSDIVKNAKKIEALIEAIKIEGKRSEELIEQKAITAADYDKEVAIGVITQKDKGVAATLIPTIVKGDASLKLLDKIKAEEMLKAHWKRLEYLQAQMNGYQSINKYLEST